MSDGITISSPCCHGSLAIQKESYVLNIKLKEFSLKHPEDDIWYNSHIPVYTCQKCGKQFAIERVNI